MTHTATNFNLQHVIYDLEHAIHAGENHICLKTLLRIVGERAYAAMLVLPALLAASPLTAVPGLSFFLALFIIFVSLQMLLRRKTMWLPASVLNMSLKRDKTLKAISYMEKPAKWLDRIMRPRLLFLTRDFGERLIITLSLLLAVISIPAMMIPLANFVLCAAILFFALGLLAKDGIVILIGGAIALTPFYIVLHYIFFS